MSTPTDPIEALWQEAHAYFQARGRVRVPYVVTDPQGNKTDFCSNDYLGLRVHPKVIEAGCKSAKKLGAGAGASRLVVQFGDEIDELEAEFARFSSWPSSVFFGSGFSANLAIFDVLNLDGEVRVSPQQEIFLDHRAHSSLHMAATHSKISTKIFRHFDYQQLARLLEQSSAQFKYIVVESLHSMDGTFEHAFELQQLCENHRALIILDEAHSTGIMGENGAGWLSLYPGLKPYILCTMSGAGKALGTAGGFVGCPVWFKERLFQKARTQIFTTGISPFVVGATLQSVRTLQSDEGFFLRKKLRDNIDFFHEGLKNISMLAPEMKSNSFFHAPGSPIFSFVVGSELEATKAAENLQNQDFLVRAIRPPTVPRGTSRLRIILRSDHSVESITGLIHYFS